MRHFINAMLVFAVMVFVAGLVPVSAKHMERLRAMQGELTDARGDAPMQLRPSILH